MSRVMSLLSWSLAAVVAVPACLVSVGLAMLFVLSEAVDAYTRPLELPEEPVMTPGITYDGRLLSDHEAHTRTYGGVPLEALSAFSYPDADARFGPARTAKTWGDLLS